MKTVREVLRLSLEYVKESRPRHEVELLIAEALGLSRLDLYLQYDRPVDESELTKIRSELVRLRKKEPFAYISGEASFCKDDFIVTRQVLIPRPESELLVEEAAKYLSSRKEPGMCFDVCTGCGCIGMSVKKLFPQWNVVLSDISPEALAVAKTNAEKLKVSVELLQGDLFEPFGKRRAQCILANPPYLSSEEWEKADASVRLYEPRLALVGGKTGIEWYQRFFSCVKNYALPEACIIVEIGSTQGESVAALAKENGFSDTSLIKDLAGHDRIVKTRF